MYRRVKSNISEEFLTKNTSAVEAEVAKKPVRTQVT